MYKEDIKLGNIYYFNNREVVVLRFESETIAFCIAKCDITHDVTGSGFCTQCLVGGDYKGSHVCDEYDEVIEAIMEEVSDEQVLWIPIVYLKEYPVEFKPNKKLKVEIEENKQALKSIKDHYIDVKSQVQVVFDDRNEIIDQINSLELRRDVLNTEVTCLNQQKINREVELNTVIKIQGSDLTITARELLNLYEAKITLDLLEGGKVENWEWYGDSIGDVDVKNEALKMLIK